MTATLIGASELNEGSRLGHEQHVGSVDVGDRVVVVDEPAGRALALSPTATLIWKCLDGEATLREIIADLADVFHTRRARVADDVLHVARHFGELGLLQGVRRDLRTIPVQVEYPRPDHDPVDREMAPGDPRLDDRYLEAPANGCLDNQFRPGEAEIDAYDLAGRRVGVRWSARGRRATPWRSCRRSALTCLCRRTSPSSSATRAA